MEPTHHATGRPRMVQLDESIGQPELAEEVLPVDLHEEPAIVGEASGDDELDLVERGGFDGEGHRVAAPCC